MTERLVAKARTRDSLQAFDKLTTTVVDGQARFVSDPAAHRAGDRAAHRRWSATNCSRGSAGPALVLPPDAVDRPPAPARAVPAGRHGPQGGRRRQRRHAGLDPAAWKASTTTTRSSSRSRRRSPRCSSSSPVAACTRTRASGSSPVSGSMQASSATSSSAGSAPRGRRRRPRLLHPPAARLERVRCLRADGPRGDGRLRRALRLDPGPGPRPLRRPGRHRVVPRRKRLFDQAIATSPGVYADQNEQRPRRPAGRRRLRPHLRRVRRLTHPRLVHRHRAAMMARWQLRSIAVGWPVDTPRLTLRPATAADVGPTWHYRQLEAVSRWLVRQPLAAEDYRVQFEVSGVAGQDAGHRAATATSSAT